MSYGQNSWMQQTKLMKMTARVPHIKLSANCHKQIETLWLSLLFTCKRSRTAQNAKCLQVIWPKCTVRPLSAIRRPTLSRCSCCRRPSGSPRLWSVFFQCHLITGISSSAVMKKICGPRLSTLLLISKTELLSRQNVRQCPQVCWGH